MSDKTTQEHHVSIDFIACRGHGVCAYFLPDNFVLDEWGYPIVKEGILPSGQLRQAKRAALLCPELALKIEKVKQTAEAAHK